VMSKGAVSPAALPQAAPAARPGPPGVPPPLAAPAWRRRDALAALQAAAGDGDVVIASTGYTGRELYALDDRPNQLYMVGSMGCASSLALGLALTRPDRRVIAVDGDGAALMRLGAFAAIGAERPHNLVHLVIDNGIHESTGGQATLAPAVDFCAVAAACGYARVARASDAAGLAAALAEDGAGPLFVHLPVRPGTAANLPRPSIAPAEVAVRLRDWLRAPERRARA